MLTTVVHSPLHSMQSVKGLFNPNSRASPLLLVSAAFLLVGEQQGRRSKATEWRRKFLVKSHER